MEAAIDLTDDDNKKIFYEDGIKWTGRTSDERKLGLENPDRALTGRVATQADLKRFDFATMRMNHDRRKQLSQRMSWELRGDAVENGGFYIRKDGYMPLNDLLIDLRERYPRHDDQLTEILHIVANCPKVRFQMFFEEDPRDERKLGRPQWIRTVAGHRPISGANPLYMYDKADRVTYDTLPPHKMLYHGTQKYYWRSILERGLTPGA